LVGQAAVADFSVEKSIVRRLTQMLKTPREDLPGRIEDLVSQVKNLEKQVAKTAQAESQALVPALVAQASQTGVLSAVVSVVKQVTQADDLRVLGQGVLSAMGDAPGVVVLGAQANGHGMVMVAANPAAVALGVHAGNLVKEASALMGGGGGGKPALAQGGGPNAGALDGAVVSLSESLGALR